MPPEEGRIPVKYLLTIYEAESTSGGARPEDVKAMMEQYESLGKELHDKGVFLAGDALQPTATATTVRVRHGERTLTDGPFAETKEQLGGYYLIEATNLDEAVDWAAKIPGASTGSVEVRPVLEFDENGQPVSATG